MPTDLKKTAGKNWKRIVRVLVLASIVGIPLWWIARESGALYYLGWMKGDQQLVFQNGEPVSSLAFSPDSEVLAIGDTDVKFWKLDTNQIKTLTHDGNRAYSLSYSPDGKFIAVGRDDTSLVTQPEGGYGIAEHDNRLQLIDASTGQVEAELMGHRLRVNAVAFSPDGKYVASASDDGTARLWEVAKATEGLVIDVKRARRTRVAFSPDGQTLAISDEDGHILLWDLLARRKRFEFMAHDGTIVSVAFSPDGKTMVTGANDKVAKVWDLETREAKLTYTERGPLPSVAFSPSGKLFAIGSGNVVELFDAATGKRISRLRGHWYYVHTIAFAPNGKMLASGGGDGSVRIWDVPER